VRKLPEGSQRLWEIKLDGYRAVAVKSDGVVTLYSRNRKTLNERSPYPVEPFAASRTALLSMAKHGSYPKASREGDFGSA